MKWFEGSAFPEVLCGSVEDCVEADDEAMVEDLEIWSDDSDVE